MAGSYSKKNRYALLIVFTLVLLLIQLNESKFSNYKYLNGNLKCKLIEMYETVAESNE